MNSQLPVTHLEKNLRAVQQRIVRAAEAAQRDPNEITLVAVSKTFPAEMVLAAYELGMRHFGENRVEEAGEKIPRIKSQNPKAEIVWHLVGHLQSRKAKEAAELFNIIHSIDSLSLAQKLDVRAAAIGKRVPVLIEVNVSGEPSKFGFALAARIEFFAAVREMLALRHLDLQGLMTIAPIVSDPNATRPHFRALRLLRDELRAQFPERAWQHLSMGMTDDFEVAIAEGATMVRIGRAIFGERPHP
ncbi:MAG: YggS family pyridoxal phosphate-dependent enzyme [Chloroflexi bacterium]|nr:YggS family pyridoxal phosphate-dependent enzyme [Chloroflexota bacterium]